MLKLYIYSKLSVHVILHHARACDFIQKVTYQARANLLTLACHGYLETILHGAILNCLQFKGVADLKVCTATEKCNIGDVVSKSF